MEWNMTRDRNHSGLSNAGGRVWGGIGCCLWLVLSAGCGQSAAPVATQTQAEATAEAADECRDRLNAAMQRVAPDSLAGQTRRDSVVNAVNSWMASCGEAEVRQLSISDRNAALLSEDALRTARASRFSENDVLYLRDCLLLKGLTESIWKQEATAGEQALAERARVTRLFRHVIRNLALMPPAETRIPVGLYEAMLTGRGTVEDRIWAFSEALRQRQVDALVLKAATPGAASGSLPETADWLVLVISGNQTLLFDPQRGTPVPAAADTSAVVTEPAGLEVLQGLDRWKSGEVFVVGHPSSFAPRMLVLQQRMEAADAAVLYEELAGGTSEIPFGGMRGEPAHGFNFKRPAQEHVLARVGYLDEGDARTALRNDVDKALCRQPVHRFPHGKPRHAHPRGDGLLVEEFARLQIELDDGLPQCRMHAGGGALGRNPGGAQEIIGDGSHWHANMLAIFRSRASPATLKRDPR